MPRKTKTGINVPEEVVPPLRDPKTQIRLLHLSPNSRSISATLETWDKASAPPFKAISYVCGRTIPPKFIYVNGKPFPVGRNCQYALYQVRLHYPESYVWVDAICINQLDLDEKAAQVAAMGEVYTMASRVLACIGLADTASETMLKATQGLDVALQELPAIWFESGSAEVNVLRSIEEEASVRAFHRAYTAFDKRPYFTRAWIVQELFGGRGRTTVLCGQEQMDWLELINIAAWMDTKHDMFYKQSPDEIYGDDCSHIRRLDRLSNIDDGIVVRFPQYLENMRDMQCQDPRDRVYSTIALIDWSMFELTPPIPDYRMSPLELAFELMNKLVKPLLSHIGVIADALELKNIDPAELLRMGLLDANTQSARSESRHTWSTAIYGGGTVLQRDVKGRLQLDLKRRMHAARIPQTTHISKDDDDDDDDDNDEILTAHGLVRVYTGNHVSALSSREIRAQDILISGAWWFDLVLRPHDDGITFTIIGAALLNAGCESRSHHCTDCLCWKLGRDSKLRCLSGRPVEIAFDLTNREALVAAIAHRAAASSGASLKQKLAYLQHYAIGTIKAGLLCFDTTAAAWHDNRTPRPWKPQCSRHWSAAYWRRSRNPSKHGAPVDAFALFRLTECMIMASEIVIADETSDVEGFDSDCSDDSQKVNSDGNSDSED